MAQSLEDRYEDAAEKVRSDPENTTYRKKYHELRDQLRERASERRAAQPSGAVTADTVNNSKVEVR